MNSTKLSKTELDRFTGTEHYYRHTLNRELLYTDGAKHVADHGGAHWLLDLIALAQRYEERISGEPFQAWTLATRPDCSATVTVEDGNDRLVWTHKIAFTDFPEAGITLWCSGNVIYLPSEY